MTCQVLWCDLQSTQHTGIAPEATLPSVSSGGQGYCRLCTFRSSKYLLDNSARGCAVDGYVAIEARRLNVDFVVKVESPLQTKNISGLSLPDIESSHSRGTTA